MSFRSTLRRRGAAAGMAAGVIAALGASGCVERLTPSVEAGDVISTSFGPAKVELVEKGAGGRIYRLVFSRCDKAMAEEDFDPVTDAGAPNPPSLQQQWLWSCHA